MASLNNWRCLVDKRNIPHFDLETEAGRIAVLSNSGSININANASNNLLTWDTNTFIDQNFITHSTSSNPSRSTFLQGGCYEISGFITISSALVSVWSGSLKLRKNGSTIISAASPAENFTGVLAGNTRGQISFEWMADLINTDYIEILCDRENGLAGAISTVSGQCLLHIKRC